MSRRLANGLLITAALLWLGMILGAPYARRVDAPGAEWIYRTFHIVCHQKPERSFHLQEQPLPVCHRCLGIYFGFAAALIILPWPRQLWRLLERQPRLLLVCAAPMAIDVFLLPNTYWSRFMTGFGAALPVAFFVEKALQQILEGRANAVEESLGAKQSERNEPA